MSLGLCFDLSVRSVNGGAAIPSRVGLASRRKWGTRDRTRGAAAMAAVGGPAFCDLPDRTMKGRPMNDPTAASRCRPASRVFSHLRLPVHTAHRLLQRSRNASSLSLAPTPAGPAPRAERHTKGASPPEAPTATRSSSRRGPHRHTATATATRRGAARETRNRPKETKGTNQAAGNIHRPSN